MRPTALLTNDDGINAAFLHALVAACVAEGFRVVVAAPAGERSWIGRAFSRHREVTLAEYPGLGEQAWSIDGTPSDCVNIALGHLLPTRPDVVLSGINIGFNATMPLCLSSGTLAGATEGAAWGLPAVACSLDLEQSLFEQVHRNSSVCPPALRPHLETACRHAARFARGLVGRPVSGLHVHSLNYPAGVTAGTAMERSTPALVRHGSLFKRSALGFAFAWNDGEDHSVERQTDVAVLERGLISHTVFDFGGTAPL
ncbi:MAG: 5'/3'-nucleotidase SurE [Verrucomicrobia bacterium]|nr:5'/3'-nucleotidase SurE [Verrucomicrobiota bacterium]